MIMVYRRARAFSMACLNRLIRTNGGIDWDAFVSVFILDLFSFLNMRSEKT